MSHLDICDTAIIGVQIWKILHTRSNDGSKLRLGRWNDEHGKEMYFWFHGLAEHLGRYEFIEISQPQARLACHLSRTSRSRGK